MNCKKYWTTWLGAAGIRAVKTIAEAAIAGIGTALLVNQVHWQYVCSTALLAGILSLLASLKGLPELDIETTKPEGE